MEINHGTINIKEIQENDLILSPKYYLNILPKLKEKFIFNNPLNNQTYKIKLDLEKLNLNTKLFIYHLLGVQKKYNNVLEVMKGGLNKLK